MSDEADVFEDQWQGRMWGVYDMEGESGPRALFRTEAKANAWLDGLDPEERGVGDFIVMRTDIYGSCWNNIGFPDPYADGFHNFTPY